MIKFPRSRNYPGCKIVHFCNSSMFFLVVLAHTDEQYNYLLNTRELIIVINVRLYQTGILRDLFDKGYVYISKLIELHVRRTLDYSPL